MKNKIVYLFILIFTVSMITSAKKVQGTCNNVCNKVNSQKCNKLKAEKEELTLPSVASFLFNI